MSLYWVRHSGDPSFHSVAAVYTGGSLVTRCHGRWSTSDEWQEDIAPPQRERCDACVRALIEARRIEKGLDELVEHERSGLAHLFDFGGES